MFSAELALLEFAQRGSARRPPRNNTSGAFNDLFFEDRSEENDVK